MSYGWPGRVVSSSVRTFPNGSGSVSLFGYFLGHFTAHDNADVGVEDMLVVGPTHQSNAVLLLIRSIPAPSHAGNLHRHILSLDHCGFVNPRCLYNSGMAGSVLDISSLHLSRHLLFGAIFPKMIAQIHKAAAVLSSSAVREISSLSCRSMGVFFLLSHVLSHILDWCAQEFRTSFKKAIADRKKEA